MLVNIIIILLHITSVIAGIAAAVLWLRSADTHIPDIMPAGHYKDTKGTLSDVWVHQLAENLKAHRAQSLISTRFNKTAASSAAVAALAQAVIYSLNLIHLLT